MNTTLMSSRQVKKEHSSRNTAAGLVAEGCNDVKVQIRVIYEGNPENTIVSEGMPVPLRRKLALAHPAPRNHRD